MTTGQNPYMGQEGQKQPPAWQGPKLPPETPPAAPKSETVILNPPPSDVSIPWPVLAILGIGAVGGLIWLAYNKSQAQSTTSDIGDDDDDGYEYEDGYDGDPEEEEEEEEEEEYDPEEEREEEEED